MDFAERHGRYALLLVLLLASAVRAAPVTFKQPTGRDIVEYASIARNLHAGHGFRLDIKAFHAVDTPVVHYSGYDRAPLLPFVLCLLQYATPEWWASRLIGPLVFLIMLGLVFDLLRRFMPVGGAFWVSALLAVHPGLYELSLLPLTEPLVLLFLALAYWAFFRLENPWVAGVGVALAFLTRPSSVAAATPLALAWLAPSVRTRSRWGFPVFVASALIGPALLIGLNRLYEAPALMMPQSYLFRVLDTKHQVHYFHEGALYASSWALLSDHASEVLRSVAKHGLYYARRLSGATTGLGVFVALWPLAWWGFRSRGWGRAALIPVAAGLLDLALYASVWSTYDGLRFTSLAVAALIVVSALGVWLAFDMMGGDSAPRWTTVRTLAFLSLMVFWSGSGVFSGYLAWRETVRGGPYANALEQLWMRADSTEWKAWARHSQFRGDLESGVIASNVPWMSHEATGMPSVLLPYDLAPGELAGFLDRYQARYVLIHGHDWPASHRQGMTLMIQELEVAGARPEFRMGGVEFWRLAAGPPRAVADAGPTFR